MNEGKMFEASAAGNKENNPQENNEQMESKNELQQVLVDQAKAIMGSSTDANPEVLAKMLLEYRIKGQLVMGKYAEDVKKMGYDDFLEVAQKAIEEKQEEPAEDEGPADGPVLTARDIPDITMDDPDRLK